MTLVKIKYENSSKEYEYEVDTFEITSISEEKVEDSILKDVIAARERNQLQRGQIITSFEFAELFTAIPVFVITTAFKKKPKIGDKIIMFYSKGRTPAWKIPNLEFGSSLANALEKETKKQDELKNLYEKLSSKDKKLDI